MDKIAIVNADDFGIVDSVTDAILQCHEAGSVSSTTLMANMAGAESAAARARAYADLSVGLHFNLTDGVPLCDPSLVPSLIDAEGRFWRRSMLMRRIAFGRVSQREVRLELEAQMVKASSVGVRVSHIDSHQHVHAHPLIFDVVADTCNRLRVPIRMPRPLRPIGVRHSATRLVKRTLMHALLQRNARQWKGRLRSTEYFGSVFDIDPGLAEAKSDHYTAIVDAADRSLELMVHVVTCAQDVEGITRIGQLSEAEWRFLSTGALGSILANRGWRLTSYSEAALLSL